ncbi:peptide/nickel transport system substrate-binding protein [Mycetocola sp. BIGb0189]|uniref:ABC transporter family substrate-binding protein n=1 Tax=Mycetocola sp. BIGb0189 TaxID=2940604 RepID=UPI0021689EC2|nr:ABC transporter family substrate-binding protein [Mycetocola sp. BIGb0189]MCS4275499.1 peptide/nickel transport system substrate-binding protein [Mycetocola sp. BIGb0189]
MNTTTKTLGGGLVLLLALSLAGCSPGTREARPTTAGELPTTDYDAAEPGELKDGGSLTLPLESFPDNFNFSQLDGYTGDTASVIYPTTVRLFNVDDSGQRSVNPDFATSIERVPGEPFTIEYALNPKAVWEDGTPIGLADFVGTWQSQNGSNPDYLPVATTGYDRITQITAGEKPNSVRVVFDRVYASWQALFFPLLPPAVTATPTAFNETFRTQGPPSAGPFRIAESTPDKLTVRLVRNERWWGAPPRLSEIVLRGVDQSASAQAYANKEFDVLDIASSVDAFKTAQSRADGQVFASKGLPWTHLTLNTATGPLADLAVRQAIGKAINREQILRSVVEPMGLTGSLVENYLYVPGQKGYQPNGKEALSYDPEAARKILDRAGYTGEKVRSKDGVPLKIDITIPAGIATSRQRVDQIAADLAEVGIQAVANEVPTSGLFKDFVTPRQFSSTIFSYSGGLDPIVESRDSYASVESPQNYSGIDDPRLAALFERAEGEEDPEVQRATINEIDRDLWESLPIIPLFQRPTVVGVTKGLANFGATQFEPTDWTRVGWRK